MPNLYDLHLTKVPPTANGSTPKYATPNLRNPERQQPFVKPQPLDINIAPYRQQHGRKPQGRGYWTFQVSAITPDDLQTTWAYRNSGKVTYGEAAADIRQICRTKFCPHALIQITLQA